MLDFDAMHTPEDVHAKFSYVEERVVFSTDPNKDEFKVNQRAVNGLCLFGEDLVAS